jgi:membrane protease YdiL (CAAX protease family)
MGQPRPWATLLVLVGLLAVSNVASNRLLPDALYVPWNLGMTGLLVLLAVRVDGRSADELGLSRDRLPAGLRLGGAIVGLVAVTMLAGAALPGTRELFDDARVDGATAAGVAYDALLRVPFGTVVLEEVAFRGVLPAVLAARTTTRNAVIVSQGLFGLWHVLPSLHLADRNDVATDLFGKGATVVPVVFAVVSTAVAGVGLWLLRRWSGSLAAPMLTHWATNGLGYLLAYLATR